MSRKQIGIVLVALATAGLIGLGMAGTRGAGHIPAVKALMPARAGSSQQPQTVRFVKDPSPAPAFLASDLNGNPISTVQWRGKVTLLDFWATWCGPCREEIPELNDLQKEFGDKLQILGASVDEAPPEAVKTFDERTGIIYPVFMANSQLQAEYGGVAALPTIFIADTEGRIVAKNVGLRPASEYELEIKALLGSTKGVQIETFEDTGQVFLKNAKNATELPGIDLSKLTASQKRVALKKLNSENCTCGCNLTLAECRMIDTSCPTSGGLAEEIVKQVARAPHGSTSN
ncbi:MAG: TlpA family protein disulfide reductase [Candidatus Acidiferrales bacterium]